jgi:hypothetical protein
LSDWLAAAMHKVDKGKSGSVTLDILKETALRGPRLRKIHSEAQECEKAFAAEEVGPEDLIEEVCGDQKEATTDSTANGSNGAALNGSHDKPKTQRRLKPGQRRQKYDTFVPNQRKAKL